jgi:hypothetical protein
VTCLQLCFQIVKLRLTENTSTTKNSCLTFCLNVCNVEIYGLSNPELYNFVTYDTSNNTTSNRYNCLSFMSEEQHQQPFSCISDDPYTAFILEEAEKLYNNKLMIELINDGISAAAASRVSLLPPDNDRQNQSIRVIIHIKCKDLGIMMV